MSTKNYALDFLVSNGLFDPSSILINPVITESNAPLGHERSVQPDVAVKNNDTTLFVFVVHGSESANMESVTEKLQSIELILFGPYRVNVPTTASRVVLLFESPLVQSAYEAFLLQKGYAFEFPLFLTNNIDQKITQYPKEKGFMQRFKGRLCNFCKRAFEY